MSIGSPRVLLECTWSAPAGSAVNSFRVLLRCVRCVQRTRLGPLVAGKTGLLNALVLDRTLSSIEFDPEWVHGWFGAYAPIKHACFVGRRSGPFMVNLHWWSSLAPDPVDTVRFHSLEPNTCRTSTSQNCVVGASSKRPVPVYDTGFMRTNKVVWTSCGTSD